MPLLTCPSIADWAAPDYDAIIRQRLTVLERIHADPKATASIVEDMKAVYREYPAQFISDWMITVDPRNAAKKLPVVMPFIPYGAQVEFIDFIVANWRASNSCMIEKSRAVGASWLSMALAAWFLLLHDNVTVGVGSRIKDQVDLSGSPNTLFYKLRQILRFIPREFRGNYLEQKHSAYMRVSHPDTGSAVIGEGGDNIGRGSRTSIYFIDEAAHLERPQLIDASLSATTNCRVDMSSVNGMANSFAEKRFEGRIPVFTMHYRDNPLMTPEYIQGKKDELGPVVFNQEYELNYSASVDRQIIRPEWVDAAIDAHVKLGFAPTGQKFCAMDVADLGADKNAWAGRHGVVLQHCKSWRGDGSDIVAEGTRALDYTAEYGSNSFTWDEEGMGHGIKGAVRQYNERPNLKRRMIGIPYRGGAAVAFPEQKVRGHDGKHLDVKNVDHYLNKAAQDWFALAFRFQQTWRAVNGQSYDPEDLISLDSKTITELTRLRGELVQPQWEKTQTGKVRVMKAPEGAASPNLADSVRMVYQVRSAGWNISKEDLAAI